MTQDEANKIAKVIGTVDSGCPVCVGNLCDYLNAENLGFTFAKTGKNVNFIPPDMRHLSPDELEEYGVSFRSVEVIATPIDAGN